MMQQGDQVAERSHDSLKNYVNAAHRFLLTGLAHHSRHKMGHANSK